MISEWTGPRSSGFFDFFFRNRSFLLLNGRKRFNTANRSMPLCFIFLNTFSNMFWLTCLSLFWPYGRPTFLRIIFLFFITFGPFLAQYIWPQFYELFLTNFMTVLLSCSFTTSITFVASSWINFYGNFFYHTFTIFKFLMVWM